VAVLIGPKTFSAAEDFLAPLKMSKRATLVGAPSGGSTGQPLSVPLYNAFARICTKWDRFADGTEFVGVGVQPDVPVELTIADVAAGRDAVLEKALEILKTR
jgi:C-terminal processing protease CtpA/Prc